jgi:hypothetical protein
MQVIHEQQRSIVHALGLGTLSIAWKRLASLPPSPATYSYDASRPGLLSFRVEQIPFAPSED